MNISRFFSAYFSAYYYVFQCHKSRTLHTIRPNFPTRVNTYLNTFIDVIRIVCVVATIVFFRVSFV